MAPAPAWRLIRSSPSAAVLDFEQGTKFDYSNSNYEVLGGILEKVSGKKYGDLLRERLSAPLGMNDSELDNDELILAPAGSRI